MKSNLPIICVLVFLCAAVIIAGVVMYYKPVYPDPQSTTNTNVATQSNQLNQTSYPNNDVFNVSTTTEMFEGTTLTIQSSTCEEGFKCVKIYLCTEVGEPITDGSGLIQPRFGEREDVEEAPPLQCPSFDEMCCKLPENNGSA